MYELEAGTVGEQLQVRAIPRLLATHSARALAPEVHESPSQYRSVTPLMTPLQTGRAQL